MLSLLAAGLRELLNKFEKLFQFDIFLIIEKEDRMINKTQSAGD